jgi:hypothetical protein
MLLNVSATVWVRSSKNVKQFRELVLRNERKRQLQSTFENIDERARSKSNKSDKFGDRISKCSTRIE